MPFYTFKCPKCENEKEVLQNTPEPPNCKKCSTILPRNFITMERIYKANAKPGSKNGSWGFGRKKG